MNIKQLIEHAITEDMPEGDITTDSLEIQSSPGRAMVGIGVCVGLSFLYWLFFSSSLSVGKYGVLHPVLAAWAPNILIGLLAVYLIRKVHA